MKYLRFSDARHTVYTHNNPCGWYVDVDKSCEGCNEHPCEPYTPERKAWALLTGYKDGGVRE